MREHINSETFSGQTFYIGLDVHKKTWKVSILTQERELRNFAMNPSAEELERYLRKNYPGGNYKAEIGHETTWRGWKILPMKALPQNWPWMPNCVQVRIYEQNY